MHTDFKNNADWSRGDLLYGTSDSRGVYLRANFSDTYNKRGHEYRSYIDDYNNGFFCNTLADGFSDGDSMDAIIEQLNRQTGRYADLLSVHKKYAPQVTLRMNPFVVMQKEGLMASAMQLAREYEKLDSNSAQARLKKSRIKLLMHKAYERKAIRRGCKYGLQMVAMELNADLPRAQIHFLLDEMDMRDVINKKAVEKSDVISGMTYKYVYITTTELRSACKHWQQFNEEKVHFYLNGEEVGAPWRNAWKGKKDCLHAHNQKSRDNHPSWWAPLTGEAVDATAQRSRGRGEPIRIDKVQKVRRQWEDRIRKNNPS